MSEANTIVDLVTKFGDLWQDKADSLPEFNSNTRNDFITLVETRIADLPEMRDILGVANTLVSSYYLSSLSQIIGIPGVNIGRTLDKVAVKRDPIKGAVAGGLGLMRYLGAESIGGTLGAPGNFTSYLMAESYSNGGATGAAFGKGDYGKVLSTNDDLSTGKQFEFIIERDGNRVPVNLTVALAVSLIDPESLKSVLGVGGMSMMFEERIIKAKAGDLKWLRDIVFSRDIIDEMRKNRHRDKTGYYQKVMSRRSNNWLAGLLSMNWSVNNASSIIVASQETVDDLEVELGGPLSDFEIRSRVFKDTLTMLILVVDQRWEQVTIYHRGLDDATEVPFKDLRRSKGGNNMDVDEIIRAYNAGSAPMGR